MEFGAFCWASPVAVAKLVAEDQVGRDSDWRPGWLAASALIAGEGRTWVPRNPRGVLLDPNDAQLERETGGNKVWNARGTESAGRGQDVGLGTGHLDKQSTQKGGLLEAGVLLRLMGKLPYAPFSLSA